MSEEDLMNHMIPMHIPENAQIKGGTITSALPDLPPMSEMNTPNSTQKKEHLIRNEHAINPLPSKNSEAKIL